MTPPLQGHNMVSEGHEERIQRVEQSMMQLSTQIAENGIKVGYMTQQIAEVKKDLTDKMDNLVVDLSSKLDDTVAAINKVTDKVSDQDKRIEHLEVSESTRKKRLAAIRKVIISAITVGVGALITKLIEGWHG